MTKPNDYGVFTRYTPDLPNTDPRVLMGVMWFKNEAGADWYEFQKLLPNSGTYMTVEATGRIRVSSPDPTMLVPDGLRVVRIADAKTNAEIEGKFIDLKTGVLSDPPPVVPVVISRRQFFQQLAVLGIITKDEALSAMRNGSTPAALNTLVQAIPDAGERFDAEMLVSGATDFLRYHPVTIQIGSAFGMTPAEIDQFFIDAGAL